MAAGVGILLENLGLITLNWEMVIGPLFAMVGLIFLLVFFLNRDNWWALIPGMVLIALAIIIFMGQQSFTENWTGTVFLGLIGLAFLLIYAFRRENWWAIIPTGALLALAVGSVIPEGNDLLQGGVFFLGFALMFGLLYLLPNPQRRLTWALYPAGILLIIALLVILGATNLLTFVWPVLLLIAGAVIIYRSLRRHETSWNRFFQHKQQL